VSVLLQKAQEEMSSSNDRTIEEGEEGTVSSKETQQLLDSLTAVPSNMQVDAIDTFTNYRGIQVNWTDPQIIIRTFQAAPYVLKWW
jgi:hypothetical protein